MNLLETTTKLTEQLHTFAAFLKLYHDKFPDIIKERAMPGIDAGESEPQLWINCSYTDSKTRDLILSAYGEIFGKSGWVASASGREYTWTKSISNVTLKIYGAKVLPEAPTYKVSPSEFPILITNGDNDTEGLVIDRITE